MSLPAASDCPAEESLLAFARGELDEPERAAVITHLDTCPVCREVVVTVAREDEVAGSEIA